MHCKSNSSTDWFEFLTGGHPSYYLFIAFICSFSNIACAYRPWFFTLPISCMRLPAMIPLSLIFLLSFFDNHLTKNCPIFTNLPLHKNNKKTFFCFTNIWPTITLSKLPHFSSNLPLHKNYSFLPFSKYAPMLQL